MNEQNLKDLLVSIKQLKQTSLVLDGVILTPFIDAIDTVVDEFECHFMADLEILRDDYAALETEMEEANSTIEDLQNTIETLEAQIVETIKH